jgi:hypothetical protein
MSVNDLIDAQRRMEESQSKAKRAKMSTTTTEDYLRLVQALVIRNQLPPEQLAMIASSSVPVDPCEFARFTPGFSSERKYAYAKAYKSLAQDAIDWPSVQERLAAMATEFLYQRESRERARIETEPLESPRTVGGLWCGLFEHDGWFAHVRVPDLAFAYRGPSLFLSAMRKAGAHVAFLFADEQITDACFGPPGGEIHQALLTYVCTHGKCPESGYQAYLHRGIWEPRKTRFGSERPIVVIFDTCNLIEASQGWQKTWADTLRGGSVRLLLGSLKIFSLQSACRTRMRGSMRFARSR